MVVPGKELHLSTLSAPKTVGLVSRAVHNVFIKFFFLKNRDGRYSVPGVLTLPLPWLGVSVQSPESLSHQGFFSA